MERAEAYSCWVFEMAWFLCLRGLRGTLSQYVIEETCDLFILKLESFVSSISSTRLKSSFAMLKLDFMSSSILSQLERFMSLF